MRNYLMVMLMTAIPTGREVEAAMEKLGVLGSFGSSAMLFVDDKMR
jgi:hypothetical protein